jgi:hypothetical protein
VKRGEEKEREREREREKLPLIFFYPSTLGLVAEPKPKERQ